ncbi:hypothetical protein JCM10449v2_001138 [Rhodotorula kratochvilovae]
MLPLARILSPEDRADYAHTLLQESTTLPPTEVKPVAALLFLLELLAWLKAHPNPDQSSEEHPGTFVVDNNDHNADSSAASTDDEPQGARTGVADGPQAGSSAQGLVEGRGGDAPADWNAWREYLSELYLSPPDDASSASSTAGAPSPLFLPPATLTHLRRALSRSSFDPDTRSLLLSGCAGSVLLYLSPDLHSTDPLPEPDVCRSLDMLMAEVRSPTFPSPLPSSTVSSIAVTLAATRRSPAASKQRTDVARQTLATLLGHYVSPVSFGRRAEPGGRIAFASSVADDALIIDAFPSPPAPSVVAAASSTASTTSDDDDDDPDADTRSIAAGIRDAHASIARKDDKLRWLLGDNFQPGASPRAGSSSAPTRSSPQPARTRELSHESSMSSLAAGSGSSSPVTVSKRHQRFTSTSSSTAPLLNEDAASASRPPLSPTSRSFLHKRGVSTGSALINAASPPPLPLQQTSRRISGEITLPPQPFGDLAPAIPHVAAPSSSLAPPAPLSPRRTSLDSALDARRAGGTQRPMNCNNLSAEERRALVRRSKKLEGFFGAPFQEEAAARVLVDGQRDLLSAPAGALSPVTGSTPSTAPSSRRASLAPPGAGPAQGHTLGAASRLDARRPSALSLSSSSQGSTSASASGAAASAGGSRPPRSPRLHRSSSSPSRGRRSSSFSSLAEPQHAYFSERLARERARDERDERDERRRKLDKVRRVLGERVPLALVVPGEAGAEPEEPQAGEGAPMGRSRSRGGVGAGVGGMLRDKLKRGQAPAPPVGAGADPGWGYVEPRWEEAPREDGDEGTRKGRQGVEALQKARKLENLFGDLPPPALFLSQASPGPYSPGAGPSSSRPPLSAARHRRSVSDLSGLAHSPFAPHATAGSWRPSPASASAPLRREGTHSSVNSYRQSIASLQYVMERDPHALDEVVRVYSAAQREADDAVASSAATSASATEDEEDDEDDAAQEEDEQPLVPPGMQRSLSASSNRAVRQAQKLSNFFGTTHGEVWRMLLNDIEASIADDDSLDDDERAEVLAGVERLRQSASSPRA